MYTFEQTANTLIDFLKNEGSWFQYSVVHNGTRRRVCVEMGVQGCFVEEAYLDFDGALKVRLDKEVSPTFPDSEDFAVWLHETLNPVVSITQ